MKKMKKKLENRLAKYLKCGFSKPQMKEIRKGIKHGLSTKQVDSYANLQNTPYYMKCVREGLEKGLKEDYVKLLFNSGELSQDLELEEVMYDMTGLDGLDEEDDLDD